MKQTCARLVICDMQREFHIQLSEDKAFLAYSVQIRGKADPVETVYHSAALYPFGSRMFSYVKIRLRLSGITEI